MTFAKVFSLGLLLVLSIGNALFWMVAPAILLMGLYFPVGINFGMPSDAHIASLLATDTNEVKEFLQAIPLWQFLVPFGVAALLLFVRRAVVRWGGVDRRGIILVFALLIACSLGDFQGIRQAYRSGKKVAQTWHAMNFTDTSSMWHVVSASPKYRNHVIVIGESVRRDYMHAYGYPVENTPFMESSPGILYEGFTAAGDHTVTALSGALTLNTPGSREPNFRLNLVGLANDAGFATSWFSNQGYFSGSDTPVTVMARSAERKVWVNASSKGYGISTENSSDSRLLPLIREELKRPDARPKVIFVHIYGNHTLACKRLHEQALLPAPPREHEDFYKEIFCYVSAIRQTDTFLSEVAGMLREAGEPWSMIYFADHGVTHNVLGGRVVLNHQHPADRHRDVPLFMTASDSTEQRRIRGLRFEHSFTEGVMQWLGVITKEMPEPRDLFRAADDSDPEDIRTMLKKRRPDKALNVLEKDFPAFPW